MGNPNEFGCGCQYGRNEIFPVLYEGRLIFSSNGLPVSGDMTCSMPTMITKE